MGDEKGAVSHKVDIAYSTPVNFLIFRGLEARAAYIPAEKAAEGEVALHADTLSVKVNGQQSLEAGSSPTCCAMAELRGDIWWVFLFSSLQGLLPFSRFLLISARLTVGS